MSVAEQLRVLVFLGIVTTVYVLAVGVVLRWALSKLRLATPPSSSWFTRIILSLAAAGLGSMAYGFFVEPYWLSVSRIRIETAKLPKGYGPLRIVHISDMHSDPEPRLEDELPEIVRAEKPDLIVFTGDAINSATGLPVFRMCLTELARIAPTYVVRGNWDAWYWKGLDLFRGTGAHELDGFPAIIDVQGVRIWLGGLAVGNEARLDAMLENVPVGAYQIFLYHYSDLIRELAERNVDLYLAGHTHGGQIALPFYGALVTLSKFGKRYEAGLYQEQETMLYVNRGLGMEGGTAPRVRFWARPEVTVVEVVPSLR